jgi:hypothetical protein
MDPEFVDHYGFRSNPGEEIKIIEVPTDKSSVMRENARMQKWRRMLDNPNLKKMVILRESMLKKRCRKGIPDCLRFKVWPILGETWKLKQQFHYPYQALLDSEHAPALDDIKLDVSRTFPNHKLFIEELGIGQESLKNVLKAVSITHSRMGYCQGLNFVAGTFLMYLSDEEAYWLLHSIMTKYPMEALYADLTNLQKPLYVIDQLVKEKFPKVAALFENQDIRAVIYAPGWLLTLYATALPFNVVLRIVDAFLLENFKILYRIALAIIKYKEKALLQCQRIDQLLMEIKDFTAPCWKDEDKLMDTAFSIKLSRKDIVRIERTYVPPKPRPKYNPQN